MLSPNRQNCAECGMSSETVNFIARVEAVMPRWENNVAYPSLPHFPQWILRRQRCIVRMRERRLCGASNRCGRTCKTLAIGVSLAPLKVLL